MIWMLKYTWMKWAKCDSMLNMFSKVNDYILTPIKSFNLSVAWL